MDLETAHGKNEGSANNSAASGLREEIFQCSQQVVGWMAASLLNTSDSELIDVQEGEDLKA